MFENILEDAIKNMTKWGCGAPFVDLLQAANDNDTGRYNQAFAWLYLKVSQRDRGQRDWAWHEIAKQATKPGKRLTKS